MPPRRSRTLLLALVACVQLVLAPALRPRACGSNAAGMHGCCSIAAPAPQTDEHDCCCGATDGGSSLPQRDPERDPRDRPEGDGGPCGCHHTPEPWAPVDDPGLASPGHAAIVAITTAPAAVAPDPTVARTVFEARAGPPGGARPPLFVLHCAFLN